MKSWLKTQYSKNKDKDIWSQHFMVNRCGNNGNSDRLPNSQSQRKLVLNVHWKDWYWSWNSNTFATWCEELTHWKRPWCWKDWRREEKGMTEDEMVGWHHRLNGYEFEQALVDGDGQGSLACCSPWGLKRVGHDWATKLNRTPCYEKNHN